VSRSSPTVSRVRSAPGLARAASLWLALVCLVASAPALAQDFGKYEFRVQDLGGGLHWLRGAGGNVLACAGPDGVLLVDSDYEPMAAKLQAAVAALGAGPARWVVNTHWHFDHVGGNAALAQAGATIVGHANQRARMATGQRIAILEEDVAPSPAAALAGLTFTDSLTFHLNGETVDLWHVPAAHTDGDVVVRFRRANVVHAGDVFFHTGYPFLDVSSGGSIDGLIAAVEAILALADDGTRIVPGHGPLAAKADLAVYRDLLREFRDLVAREMAAGRDLAAILAAKPTARLDEKYGQTYFPPEQFTEMVYRSLGGK